MAITQDDFNLSVVETDVAVRLMQQSMEQLLEKIESIKVSLNQGKYVEKEYWIMNKKTVDKELKNLEDAAKEMSPPYCIPRRIRAIARRRDLYP